MHYLLIYDLTPDYLERREKFRDEHLKLAWEAAEKGILILGGALQNPTEKAVLLFDCDTPDVARTFAKADPYVKEGLVKSWSVRPWTTVVGKTASNPVHPKPQVK
ncbi:MAG: YciI family protein [Balneolaceae bacterium]|nr:YciI family protein [Balneolaceae bacterium]MCH8548942.1 YciI family protein [Balneolaceae bacterium]